DHRHCLLLRARSEWPSSRAADRNNELAPPHSITSSARASNVGDTDKPSALAVVRLMTRSNLVGCATGRSEGFAPRRILSTYSAARRNWSGKFAPYDIKAPASTNSRKPCIVGSPAATAEVLMRTRLEIKTGSKQT